MTNFDSPWGNRLCHHLTMMGSQSKLDSMNPVTTWMSVLRCSVTGDIVHLELISTLTLKVDNISRPVTPETSGKRSSALLTFLCKINTIFICENFKMSFLILEVWLLFIVKVNVLHIKYIFFSPLLTICCFHLPSAMSSIWFCISFFMFKGVVPGGNWAGGSGPGQLSLHLFKKKKKRNSISVSFTALIKGVVTVSYIWLCLLSPGEVCLCLCERQVSE